MPIRRSTKPAARSLTVLPLRDIVMFPHMNTPLLIGREHSIQAIDAALNLDKLVMICSQKDSSVDDPRIDELYEYGTVARVVHSMRLPNKLLKVVIEGLYRARIVKAVKNESCLQAEVEILKEDAVPSDKEFTTLTHRTHEMFTHYVHVVGTVPSDVLSSVDAMSDEYQRLYTMAAAVASSVEKKQPVLEGPALRDQMLALGQLLSGELELLKLEEEIDVKVSDSIQKHQRKFFIQEQIRVMCRFICCSLPTSKQYKICPVVSLRSVQLGHTHPKYA